MTDNQWKKRPGHVFTQAEKMDALRDLVYEAAMEASASHPSKSKSALAGPAFDARDFQAYHQEALLDALRRTDALFVLNDIINEGRV